METDTATNSTNDRQPLNPRVMRRAIDNWLMRIGGHGVGKQVGVRKMRGNKRREEDTVVKGLPQMLGFAQRSVSGGGC